RALACHAGRLHGDRAPTPGGGHHLDSGVLFGGGNLAGSMGDTWEWDGVRWTQVASTGPAPRSATAMAYDELRGKAVLFGGVTDQSAMLQDTWEWTGPIYGCSGRATGDLNCDRRVNRDDLTVVVSS